MHIEPPRITAESLVKPPTGWMSAETTLQHFSIVTYRADPEALKKHLHPRFIPFVTSDGSALASAVNFVDHNFHVNCFPWRWSFGQTNYRAYVVDTETDAHVAWFFGTCLDSGTVLIPRRIWKLPWHRAHMHFDCEYDASAKRYTKYKMKAESQYAPAELDLLDTGERPESLDGFANLDEGIALLTHPMAGYYFRGDGTLGSYSIWHDKLSPTKAIANEALFTLFSKLGLDGGGIHSVLVQPQCDFTIYLPPRAISSTSHEAFGRR